MIIVYFVLTGRRIDNLATDADFFVPPDFLPEKQYYVQVKARRLGSEKTNFGKIDKL